MSISNRACCGFVMITILFIAGIMIGFSGCNHATGMCEPFSVEKPFTALKKYIKVYTFIYFRSAVIKSLIEFLMLSLIDDILPDSSNTMTILKKLLVVTGLSVSNTSGIYLLNEKFIDYTIYIYNHVHKKTHVKQVIIRLLFLILSISFYI